MSQYGQSVSNIILSNGIYFAISQFSYVFKEQPFTPMYKSNSMKAFNSSNVPLNEWTTPVGNRCLFYRIISTKSPWVDLE
jgi:hypothetical protein